MESTGMVNGVRAPQEGRKLWQYLASVSACLLSIAAGTAIGWTSPVLPNLEKPNDRLLLFKHQSAWVGSLLAIGAIFGAVPAGRLANSIGRKKAILSLAAPFFVSWLIIIFAANVWMLYVARLLVGIGVGATCVIVPMYIAELAEVSVKGVLGAMFQLMMTVGILYSAVFGFVLSYTWFGILCTLVVVLFVPTFILMPESPQWLITQGRKVDATKALVVLRGEEYDIKEDIASMQREAEEQATEISVLVLIRNRGVQKGLVICLGLMVFQQFSGINAVIFNAMDIFAAAKSKLSPGVASALLSLVQTVMAGAAALVIDKAGRKPLLTISSAIMGISLVALGFYFHLESKGTDVSNLGWLPLVSLVVFMIAFSVGFGPIPWMMMGEVFPAESKGFASSIAVMLNWILVFLVTRFYPDIKLAFGEAACFWIFAIFMGVATAFTILMVPETKGKTAQEVQDELNGLRNDRVV